MMRVLLNVICAGLLSFCLPTWGQNVLSYPQLPAAESGGNALLPKMSAFHAPEQDVARAERVRNAWKVEPVPVPLTRLMLDMFVKHKMAPSRGARGSALVHVAMHDAFELAAGQKLDQRLTVAAAASRVFGYLFPNEEGAFDRMADQLMVKAIRESGPAFQAQLTQSVLLGRHVGDAVVDYADKDGAQRGWNALRLEYYGQHRYYGPGTWEPTPPYFYYPPDEPFAPQWRPWVLSSASEFRAVPLEYGSKAYLDELREVVEVGASLTDEQRRIAHFWVDGHGSVTPTGHWNQIAMDAVLQSRMNDRSAVRLGMILNLALADSFIAAWDTKYHYWTTRPVTAAPELLGISFTPAILTPPFPSFVSGHACTSGAAGEILAEFFPNKARQFRAMAQQAADSRLYGGIHFRHDNESGLEMGRNVARKALSTYPVR
ncbi:MAG: hypothetical protein A3E51_08615 [Burkholderiales bacterium RIFCSPHIGHO2_12_FULL_67_38]|nr:MAG: hypothetical protein A3I64_23170 [Burkholderiales bacterium RIFCSPLOWO2_02_FULL_67_64]OGB37805.1 MAG: hypothetical protein A3E51_08615 [Burkholderiales bacterium RIFCSPHIGHO2_12_FULL_67_38]OGB76556.1 MAG: hypothetical protein A3G82_10070 [Burkholderiales bacterium RIFCSPLOWO2_12_FULL_67_210]